MKSNSVYVLVLLLLIFSAISCDNNNVNVATVTSCEDGVQNGDETGVDCGGSCPDLCPPENALEGEIVSVLELNENEEFFLTGPLVIRDGGQLIIRSGVTIRAEKSPEAYIAVTQGGKIFIYGTEDAPVVFTSSATDPAPGDWGGVLLFGKAPINNETVSRSELLDYFYGGNEPDDSSGLLRYLRVEYAGAQHNDNNNFNGLTLYGIGHLTQINNIQTHRSKGNGFQFVGGTVQPEKLMATESEKTGIIFTEGWSGNANFLFVKDHGNYALELLNNAENPLAQPWSSGQLSEISLIAMPSAFGAINFTNGGGNFNLVNTYTSGYRLGIHVSGQEAVDLVDSGSFTIDTIEFDDTALDFMPTNYNGTTNFYSTGQNLGAGNKDGLPNWATSWSTGF